MDLGLDIKDPQLSHFLYFIFAQYGFSLALTNDRSFMGGSDDMTSLVIIGGLYVGMVGTHICFGV